jgi:hypothetical protein
MNEIGPIQMLTVAFGPDARFEGRVVEELERLEAIGTVRVLDLLFVHKEEATGDLIALDVQGPNMGAITGALLGFESEDGPARDEGGVHRGVQAFGVSRSDLDSLMASLEPGIAVGVLLIEHVWARDLTRAIREAGGVPVAEGFLTPETLAEVAGDLAAVSAAIDQEQAAATA